MITAPTDFSSFSINFSFDCTLCPWGLLFCNLVIALFWLHFASRTERMIVVILYFFLFLTNSDVLFLCFIGATVSDSLIVLSILANRFTDKAGVIQAASFTLMLYFDLTFSV